jgi:purine-binding chemotaxis protein CheW
MKPVHLVGFRVGKETYGVDIAALREIVKPQVMTSVPGTARHLLGIINLRGKIIPVIDLADRLGLPPTELRQSSRILVANVNGVTVGLLVDAATEVMKLPAEVVEPPPEDVFDARREDFLEGVGRLDGRLIVLLNLEKVFSEKEVSAAVATASDSAEVAGSEPAVTT